MRPRLLLTMILISFFGVGANQTLGQNPPAMREGVPAGNWKVALVPYSGPEFESMPLQVISVVGVSSHDAISFWIRERRLRNRSDKRVMRASFTAFVYREESPEKLLVQYPIHTIVYTEVPLLAGTEWPAPCRNQRPNYCPYAHAIPGATHLLAPFIKDATLEGEYRIAIGVSRVWFEDGSTWELPGSQTNAQHILTPSPR